ncbi:MAG TPA: hypothetical protein VHR66_08485 [Gemmataceae bacterium]|jgi:hypothetical protein|nr:hypothetical protein [Gemmataceae bacterium]
MSKDKRNRSPEVPKVEPGELTAESLHTRIGANLLRTLGQPKDLHAVQVRPLWERHYRVNVLIGKDAAAITVAHSFFLEADATGNIVTTTPALARRY